MKYILTVLLSLSTLFGMAQITKVEKPKAQIVGEVKPLGKFIAEIVYYVEKEDTIYYLNFRNVEYEYVVDLVQIPFKNEEGTVESLYKTMKEVVEKKEDATILLGETTLSIDYSKGFGFAGVRLSTEKGFVHISNKQIDKLFGK